VVDGEQAEVVLTVREVEEAPVDVVRRPPGHAVQGRVRQDGLDGAPAELGLEVDGDVRPGYADLLEPHGSAGIEGRGPGELDQVVGMGERRRPEGTVHS
jgi:hypothetical protein